MGDRRLGPLNGFGACRLSRGSGMEQRHHRGKERRSSVPETESSGLDTCFDRRRVKSNSQILFLGF